MPLKMLKITALSVLVAFLVTSVDPVAFANPSPAAEISPFPAKILEIPAEFGQVTDTVIGNPKAPAFIHIQSAHGNYEAEKNIERLLAHIEKNSSIKLMLLEGASAGGETSRPGEAGRTAGKLQPELFRIFPKHPDFNRKVTDKLMQEGYLTGPEVFLVESAKKIKGWGVEDLDSYKKDREAFISVMKSDKTAQTFLMKLRAEIDRKFSAKLNKELLNLIRQEEALGSGTVSFEGWLKILGEASRKHLKLDLSDAFYQDQYPFLIRYYRLQSIGSKIDREKALTELGLFLNELEKRKISKEIIGVFKKGLGTRSSGLDKTRNQNESPVPSYESRSASGYSPLRRAFDLMFGKLPRDFSMKPWPAWTLYAQYTILMQELESKGLQEEMARLKDRILTALAQTPDEKKYLAEARKLYLLRRLFSLELTRAEYEELKTHRDSHLGTRTSTKPGTKTSPESLVPSPALQALFAAALEFYKVAIVRENHMFQNALKKMGDEKQNRAVIVTGGFHSDGLKKLAAAKGCSYLQITPRITEISKRDHEIYLKSMLGTREFETSQLSQVPVAALNSLLGVFGLPGVRNIGNGILRETKTEIDSTDVSERSGLSEEARYAKVWKAFGLTPPVDRPGAEDFGKRPSLAQPRVTNPARVLASTVGGRSEARGLQQGLVARDSGFVKPQTSPEELVPSPVLLRSEARNAIDEVRIAEQDFAAVKKEYQQAVQEGSSKIKFWEVQLDNAMDDLCQILPWEDAAAIRKEVEELKDKGEEAQIKRDARIAAKKDGYGEMMVLGFLGALTSLQVGPFDQYRRPKKENPTIVLAYSRDRDAKEFFLPAFSDNKIGVFPSMSFAAKYELQLMMTPQGLNIQAGKNKLVIDYIKKETALSGDRDDFLARFTLQFLDKEVNPVLGHVDSSPGMLVTMKRAKGGTVLATFENGSDYLVTMCAFSAQTERPSAERSEVRGIDLKRWLFNTVLTGVALAGLIGPSVSKVYGVEEGLRWALMTFSLTMGISPLLLLPRILRGEGFVTSGAETQQKQETNSSALPTDEQPEMKNIPWGMTQSIKFLAALILASNKGKKIKVGKFEKAVKAVMKSSIKDITSSYSEKEEFFPMCRFLERAGYLEGEHYTSYVWTDKAMKLIQENQGDIKSKNLEALMKTIIRELFIGESAAARPNIEKFREAQPELERAGYRVTIKDDGTGFVRFEKSEKTIRVSSDGSLEVKSDYDASGSMVFGEEKTEFRQTNESRRPAGSHFIYEGPNPVTAIRINENGQPTLVVQNVFLWFYNTFWNRYTPSLESLPARMIPYSQSRSEARTDAKAVSMPLTGCENIKKFLISKGLALKEVKYLLGNVWSAYFKGTSMSAQVFDHEGKTHVAIEGRYKDKNRPSKLGYFVIQNGKVEWKIGRDTEYQLSFIEAIPDNPFLYGFYASGKNSSYYLLAGHSTGKFYIHPLQNEQALVHADLPDSVKDSFGKGTFWEMRYISSENGGTRVVIEEKKFSSLQDLEGTFTGKILAEFDFAGMKWVQGELSRSEERSELRTAPKGTANYAESGEATVRAENQQTPETASQVTANGVMTDLIKKAQGKSGLKSFLFGSRKALLADWDKFFTERKYDSSMPWTFANADRILNRLTHQIGLAEKNTTASLAKNEPALMTIGIFGIIAVIGILFQACWAARFPPEVALYEDAYMEFMKGPGALTIGSIIIISLFISRLITPDTFAFWSTGYRLSLLRDILQEKVEFEKLKKKLEDQSNRLQEELEKLARLERLGTRTPEIKSEIEKTVESAATALFAFEEFFPLLLEFKEGRAVVEKKIPLLLGLLKNPDPRIYRIAQFALVKAGDLILPAVRETFNIKEPVERLAGARGKSRVLFSYIEILQKAKQESATGNDVSIDRILKVLVEILKNTQNHARPESRSIRSDSVMDRILGLFRSEDRRNEVSDQDGNPGKQTRRWQPIQPFFQSLILFLASSFLIFPISRAFPVPQSNQKLKGILPRVSESRVTRKIKELELEARDPKFVEVEQVEPFINTTIGKVDVGVERHWVGNLASRPRFREALTHFLTHFPAILAIMEASTRTDQFLLVHTAHTVKDGPVVMVEVKRRTREGLIDAVEISTISNAGEKQIIGEKEILDLEEQPEKSILERIFSMIKATPFADMMPERQITLKKEQRYYLDGFWSIPDDNSPEIGISVPPDPEAGTVHIIATSRWGSDNYITLSEGQSFNLRDMNVFSRWKSATVVKIDFKRGKVTLKLFRSENRRNEVLDQGGNPESNRLPSLESVFKGIVLAPVFLLSAVFLAFVPILKTPTTWSLIAEISMSVALVLLAVVYALPPIKYFRAVRDMKAKELRALIERIIDEKIVPVQLSLLERENVKKGQEGKPLEKKVEEITKRHIKTFLPKNLFRLYGKIFQRLSIRDKITHKETDLALHLLKFLYFGNDTQYLSEAPLGNVDEASYIDYLEHLILSAMSEAKAEGVPSDDELEKMGALARELFVNSFSRELLLLIKVAGDLVDDPEVFKLSNMNFPSHLAIEPSKEWSKAEKQEQVLRWFLRNLCQVRGNGLANVSAFDAFPAQTLLVLYPEAEKLLKTIQSRSETRKSSDSIQRPAVEHFRQSSSDRAQAQAQTQDGIIVKVLRIANRLDIKIGSRDLVIWTGLDSMKKQTPAQDLVDFLSKYGIRFHTMAADNHEFKVQNSDGREINVLTGVSAQDLADEIVRWLDARSFLQSFRTVQEELTLFFDALHPTMKWMQQTSNAPDSDLAKLARKITQTYWELSHLIGRSPALEQDILALEKSPETADQELATLAKTFVEMKKQKIKLDDRFVVSQLFEFFTQRKGNSEDIPRVYQYFAEAGTR